MLMQRHFIWTLTFLSIFELLNIPLISLAEEERWTKKANMPTARGWLSTSVVNGKIYAIGGRKDRLDLSTVEEYDPLTDKWTKKADMPTARIALSTSVLNGKIYACGGSGGGTSLATVEEYDPVVDKWTKKNPLPTTRHGLSTSAVNGKIYAIGGEEGPWITEYNPITDKWTNKANMSIKRWWLSTSVVNGKIYAFGGRGIAGVNIVSLPTVEEYDPVADKWTRKADMPAPSGSLSTSVVNGKNYVVGVWKEGDGAWRIEEYDPKTDTWTRKADMPTKRWGFSTSAVNGKIYVIGGFDGNGQPVSTVEEYDPGFAAEDKGIEARGKLVTSWGQIKAKY